MEKSLLSVRVEFTFSKGRVLRMMNNNIKVRKMLSKSCIGYLAHIIGKTDNVVLNLQFALIVFEF